MFEETPLNMALLGINLQDNPAFARLNSPQREVAQTSLGAFAVGVREGFLDPSGIKRILDFGANVGGSTFTLVNIAQLLGAEVEAIEITETHIQIEANRILPSKDIHFGDGVEYLASKKGSKRFDLVTSFLAGGDRDAVLFKSLSKASALGLNPGGNLLLAYEDMTGDAARKILDGVGDYHFYRSGVSVNRSYLSSDCFVIPKATCARISSLFK